MRIELSRKIDSTTQTGGNYIPHFGEEGFIEPRDLYVGDSILKWQIWQKEDVGYEDGEALTTGEAMMQIEEKFGNGWRFNTK